MMRRLAATRVITALALLALVLALAIPVGASSYLPEATAIAISGADAVAEAVAEAVAAANLPQATLVRRVETTQPYVAITVDDFITKDYSWRTAITILKTADDTGAKLTLCPAGVGLTAYAKSQPGQATEIKALFAGGAYELCNHTYSHPYMDRLSLSAQVSEMQRGKASVKGFFNMDTGQVFRPPFGHWNADTLKAAAQAGYRYVAVWSIDTRDSVGPEKSAQQLLDSVRCAAPGDIILMHANRRSSAAALPLILQKLHAKGLQPVTLSTLIASGKPVTANLTYSQRQPYCQR